MKRGARVTDPSAWMHDTGSDANDPIARFPWSLRATPGHENVEVRGQIARPRCALAEAAFAPPRTTALEDLRKRGSRCIAFLSMSNDVTPLPDGAPW